MAIPGMPTYLSPPSTAPSAAPVVTVEVEAPEPPETTETFGDAQWIKIYKTDLTREATPDDLLTGNGVVPTDLAQIEISWDLLQASPPSNCNQSRKGSSSTVKPDTRAIVRRIETYKYTGGYDATTHQAVCADLTCTAPSAGELGNLIGANNTAINVNPDSLIVSKSGNGAVQDATKGGSIKCGSSCTAFTSAGAMVTLSASPASGSAFTGWTGACSGAGPVCAVTINGNTSVQAVFSK